MKSIFEHVVLVVAHQVWQVIFRQIIFWASISPLITYGAAIQENDIVISNVKVEPVLPWGKIFIQYDVDGAAPNDDGLLALSVAASNRVTGVVTYARTLSGDTAFAIGAHKLIWDFSADGIDFGGQVLNFTITYYSTLYCIIDLSDGMNVSKYPMSWMGNVPVGGWTDEYKLNKLVLRRIRFGENVYYIGVFEMTQKQYQLVVGSQPSLTNIGDMRPVVQVSWNSVKNDFIPVLQKKTGLSIELPTQAQWEYACRAGTKTVYSYGDVANGDYMWFSSNSGGGTHVVGTRCPNEWGLYDMHGNVWEYISISGYKCGGGYCDYLFASRASNADDCTSSSCSWQGADVTNVNVGFRIVSNQLTE